MAGEGIQNYVDMAAGVTKATRAKALAAAKSLLATAGLEDVATDATDRVGKLAEEVIAASRANRLLMTKLVVSEVDKAAARLGFARSEELEDLRRELADLRMSMAHAAAHPGEVPEPAPFASDLGIPDPPVSVDTLPEPDDAPLIEPITEPLVTPPSSMPAEKAPAKKAPVKTAAKKAPAKKAPAKKTATTRTATIKAAVRKVAAASDTPTPAKKSAATKLAAKKPAAKKAATNTTVGSA